MPRNYFSFINIGGLALGMASCLALLLYVAHEWGYDRQFDKFSNIYRVYENRDRGGEIQSLATAPATLAPVAQQVIPGVARAVRFMETRPRLLSHGANCSVQSGYYTDSGFFGMMNYHFLSGSRITALSDPHSIVLTRKLAGLLFGQADPMGQTIHISKQDLRVTGVIEDLPTNETLQFSYILPWSFFEAANPWLRTAGWNTNDCHTLIELTDPTGLSRAEAALRQLFRSNLEDTHTVPFLHPMSQWRLYAQFKDGKVSGGRIEQVRLFAILAIGILLIACINFMKLSMARSRKRAREVGIRKTIGSSRKDLVRQFFLESFFFSMIASVPALLLLQAGLPLLNRLLDTDLQIPYTSRAFWSGFATLVFLTGLLAGSYPSGMARTGRGALRFRQTLMAFL